MWKTDGTVTGTVKVKDFITYPYQSPTRVLAWYDGGIILKGASPTGEAGLWKSDGTEAGTVLLKTFGLDSLQEAAQRTARSTSMPRTNTAPSCSSPTAPRKGPA